MQSDPRVWWILDPRHAHHCDDCKRMATHSPYTSPWDATNPLNQTPGDGSTSCGTDCTCIISYAPPGPNNPDMAAFQNPDHLSLLLQTFTHGQVRFIEEYSLEATSRHTANGEIDALVLHNESLIERNEYQYIRYFRTAESGASIQLWEHTADRPFPTPGKRQKGFDNRFRLVTEWPEDQVRWVLSPDALRRYKATAPDVPEWSAEDNE